MIIFLIILACVALLGIKVRPVGFFEDHLSGKKTGSVRGILIMIIVLSHMRAYIDMSEHFTVSFYNYFMLFLGQAMVALFFFYSGYGIYESVKRRPNYFDGFVENRVFKIMYHFGISVILFWILNVAVLGERVTLDTLVKAFLGFKSIGNSSWFVFTMLLVYIFAFLVFRFFGKYPLVAIGAILALTVGFAACIELNKYERLWYDTAFCFALGFLWSYFKEKIDGLMRRHTVYYIALAVSIAAFVAATVVYRQGFNPVLGTLKNLLFAVAFTLLSMRLSLHNKILEWLGKHSFGIYLLHRIPMILLSHFGILSDNKYLFAALVIALTLPLAAGFTRLCELTDRIIYPKRAA